MTFRLGKITLLLVLALLVAIACAEILEDDLDVEDVAEEELYEEVRQEESVERGPSLSFTTKPKVVCGVFILCERRHGGPTADLITSDKNDLFVKTRGQCRTFRVKGKCKRILKLDHADLWPVHGEEFDELCFYKESKQACKFGTVLVVKREHGRDIVKLKCTRNFDAHTVEFCMYENPDKCPHN